MRRNEARATRIAVFHPLVVPGLLQTADYIRAIFATSGLSKETIEPKLAERVARAEIFNEPWREFTFVLTAGALSWCVGSSDVMVAQIEHVIDMSQRDHVALGVIPWGATATA